METLYKAIPKDAENRRTGLFDTPSLPKDVEKDLEQYELLRDFAKDSLPENIQHLFLRASITGQTLYIVFSHPMGKKEFEGKKEIILASMRRLYMERGLKGIYRFSEVEPAVECTPLSKKEEISKKYRFVEASSGEFDISNIKDPDIRKTLDDIKNTIKRRKGE